MAREVFSVELSDLNIEIKSQSEYVRDLCADYISGPIADPAFSVEASQPDVAAEAAGYSVPHSEEYCESVCIYREIAERLPAYQRAVFHGAAVEIGGKGYIFTAPSGVGKTTHVRLWGELLGDSLKIVNGDKPIIGIADGDIRVWGSPWQGKERWGNNSSAPLCAICFIKRGKINKIQRIDPSEHFNALMDQIYFPKDGDAVIKTFELIEELAKKVDFYLLECDISQEAARLSFETLTGEKYNK